MKQVLFLIIFSLLSIPGLWAQETGVGAASSAQATTGNWQNWVFAGSALVTAAVGVAIISTNTGTFGHH